MSLSSTQRLNIRFTIIHSSSPEILLFQLEKNQDASFFTLRRQRPEGRVCYLVEMAHKMQQMVDEHKLPPQPEWCRYYLGCEDWPRDLTTVPGLWKYPIPFKFSNLTFLDLGIEDATFWIIPLLNATDPAAPLRRIFIRSCCELKAQPFSFPFDALDEALGFYPAAKLLIGWAYNDEATDMFIKIFQTRLPLLYSRGGIGVLYAAGPKCKFCLSPRCR
jgi:hypothetical protein